MRVVFRGVRGSFPVAGPHTARYGGSTPCLQVSTARTTVLIDAGTGILAAGRDLLARGIRSVHLLIGHTHWDHIQGLPHFPLLYVKGAQIHVCGPARPDRSLSEVLGRQQESAFFPVSLRQVPAHLTFTEVHDGDVLALDDVQCLCHRLNHPGLVCGYRLESDGRVLTYACDVDLVTDRLLGEGMPTAGPEAALWRERLAQGARDLAHRADLLVCDTFFLPEEYKPDWGHSRPQDALQLGLDGQVRRLALFHHEPHRDDAELDRLLASCREQAAGRLEVLVATEGEEIAL
ncbi:MAG: MBL fold metallo-hydrolase [Candidatus Latescibacterota bacterium]